MEIAADNEWRIVVFVIVSYGFPCDLKVTDIDARTFYMYNVVHVRHLRRTDVDMHRVLDIRPIV